MSEYFSIIIGAIFVQNFVLARFLGCCPFLGVSKKTDTALGMGMAVTFVITMASGITWLAWNLLHLLFGAEADFLQTILFILIIASLVQFVEIVLKRFLPALYESLGIYLPLITTNCAVLGAAIITAEYTDFLKAIVFGCAAGVGFTLAIVLLAGIRERLASSNIPRALQGMPITLITASLMALAFMGFGAFGA
ncbi:MAG: RnfABCDGE type electron transport complex subunit A [Clostridia bacterium]|nr:RnfABCDGE type electron transport complex subunit A [Clostridia bacterium]